MKKMIVYGSRYGSSERYARELSRLSGVPAARCGEEGDLASCGTVVYLGGLYAGSVLGLGKAARRIPADGSVRLAVATVGLADPKIAANVESIRRTVRRQLPAKLWEKSALFHLRGAMNDAQLSPVHRAMMGLMYRMVQKTPPGERTADQKGLLETRGADFVDFVDFGALGPLLAFLAE